MVQSCDCTIAPNKGQGLTHVRQLPYQYGISSVRQLHGENEVFGPVLVSHLHCWFWGGHNSFPCTYYHHELGSVQSR